MPDADLTPAARRLADLARAHVERDGYQNMRDLRALLPILDAVAAGPNGDRVKRWARELCRISDFDPDLNRHDPDGTQPEWMFYRDDARAVIALADAETAELRRTAERAWYLLDLRADTNDTAGQAATDNLRAALDASASGGISGRG